MSKDSLFLPHDNRILHRLFGLHLGLVKHFQRRPVEDANPRFLMGPSWFLVYRREFIQFATQAEKEGKFTPEYLSPLGITNRPSPEALVDELIRQRGFRWLSQDFVKHFQRNPVVDTNPRLLMDPGLARRYGLQTRPTSPVSTTPSTNAASPESASPAPMPMMSQELMKRYGLMPRTTTNRASPTPPKASTNPPANPAPGQ